MSNTFNRILLLHLLARINYTVHRAQAKDGALRQVASLNGVIDQPIASFCRWIFDGVAAGRFLRPKSTASISAADFSSSSHLMAAPMNFCDSLDKSSNWHPLRSTARRIYCFGSLPSPQFLRLLNFFFQNFIRLDSSNFISNFIEMRWAAALAANNHRPYKSLDFCAPSCAHLVTSLSVLCLDIFIIPHALINCTQKPRRRKISQTPPPSLSFSASADWIGQLSRYLTRLP